MEYSRRLLLLSTALAYCCCSCSAHELSADHGSPHDNLRGGYRRARDTIQNIASPASPNKDHAVPTNKRMRRLRRDDELLSNIVTRYPTKKPTRSPTKSPTPRPTRSPTLSPTTAAPTSLPSAYPTTSHAPTISFEPTVHPSMVPTTSAEPTLLPSDSPTTSHAPSISHRPTGYPSLSPTVSSGPSVSPSGSPTTSNVPSLIPSTSSAPTAAPSFVTSTAISAISLVVYRSTSSKNQKDISEIDKKELENILETYVLEQTKSGLPNFQITRADLVLAALPKHEAEVEEFILIGDLVCVQSDCPSNKEMTAFVLQLLSNKGSNEQLLMLLKEEANDPTLRSAQAIDMVIFNPSGTYNNLVAAKPLFAKVTQTAENQENGGWNINNPVFISLLVVALVCHVLLIIVVVMKHRLRSSPETVCDVEIDADGSVESGTIASYNSNVDGDGSINSETPSDQSTIQGRCFSM